jgi:pyruvate dehydrogenase E2 component (dihydrolipoamide acetyltransferase)
MAQLMRMPALLADATEAILSKWLVKEGEAFTVGQPLAEVETEKALVEVPAESDGVLGKYLVAEGKTAQVGLPIAALLAAGEDPSAIDKLLAGEGSTPVAAAPAPAVTPAATPAVTPIATPVAAPTQASSPVLHTGRIFASPLARKLARELGVDLTRIAGSGPEGRIVKADIYSAQKATPTSQAAQPITHVAANPSEAVPHSRMRKAIARRLTESKQNVPHFYLSAPLIADEFLNLRKQLNEWSSTKVSVTDLILKTVAAAYSDVPQANCVWGDEAMQYFNSVDIAVAVATETGLITPVVRGVEKLRLDGLAAVTGDLFGRAREGKLKQDEIQGGTISVTNLGMYGTDEFYAIINPPQSMILAVGAAKKKPVVKDDQITIATVINFTLSVDHRSVDGALAAEWLAAFSKRFENPMWMVIGE